jgi:hypothetical protein
VISIRRVVIDTTSAGPWASGRTVAGGFRLAGVENSFTVPCLF